MADNIPLGEWSGSDATDRLRETITEFNERAGEQTAKMVKLTATIAMLTKALLFLAVAQLVAAVVIAATA